MIGATTCLYYWQNGQGETQRLPEAAWVFEKFKHALNRFRSPEVFGRTNASRLLRTHGKLPFQ